MPVDRLTVWMLAANETYRTERIKAGESESEATANAERSLAQFFPDGSLAHGHVVFDVIGEAQDAPVGVLWIGPTTDSPVDWWVWDIEVVESERGKGYGRQAMRLAEVEANARGAVTLGLNVFGFNTPARSLYESLGYETTAVQMRKSLAE